MKSKILFRQVAVALGLSVAMTGGAAAAFVASWDYTQEFEFVSASADPSTGTINTSGATFDADGIARPDDGDVVGFTKLSWGIPAGASTDPISSLVINPLTTDTTTPSNLLTQGSGATAALTSETLTGLTFAAGPKIVHNNFVLDGESDTLASAIAEDFVRLTPTTSDGIEPESVENRVLFSIQFAETENAILAGADACDARTLDGDVAFNANGCGDIFALSSAFLNTTPILTAGGLPAFLIDSFNRGNYRYDVYLREATGNLEQLADRACDAANADRGCIGWVTNEGLSTPAELQFAILATEIPVPAPGTLLLLSGGLLGLGAALRRKSRSASV